MLVVFTSFLGYDLKTAVGTSTFIMTFTALIGFISHALIHPDIVLKRWVHFIAERFLSYGNEIPYKIKRLHGVKPYSPFFVFMIKLFYSNSGVE